MLLELQLQLNEAVGSKINADTVIPIPKPAATLFASSILDS